MNFLKNLFSGKSSPATEQLQPPLTRTRLGVREPYFYKEYYDQVMIDTISFDKQTQTQYNELLKERGPDYLGHQIIEFQLADGLITELTIAYSRGDTIRSLQPLYAQAVHYFIKSWQEDYIYNHVLRIIALGVLLDTQHIYLKQLADLIKREKFQDTVINYLLSKIDPTVPPSKDLRFPEDTGLALLKEITEANPEEAARKIMLYLNNYWYTVDNLDMYYDSHKNPSKGHIGYWAFEAGAITKIMNLDDSSYKDNEYYPYDLVHWQDKR